ncbi:MAG: DUF192 domain-containing protein [archaeon]|nr:DUF192 domain-containing protein [archaeon]
MVFLLSGCTNRFQANTAKDAAPQQIIEPEKALPAGELCFPQKCISIERATTPQEQARGLMFRESISDDGGMLFIFPNEGRRFFWMKNVSFPIDMLWLDGEKKVAGITSAKPCASDPCQTYPSPEGVKYVVEVAGGFSKKNGVVVGTQVVFSG